MHEQAFVRIRLDRRLVDACLRHAGVITGKRSEFAVAHTLRRHLVNCCGLVVPEDVVPEPGRRPTSRFTTAYRIATRRPRRVRAKRPVRPVGSRRRR